MLIVSSIAIVIAVYYSYSTPVRGDAKSFASGSPQQTCRCSVLWRLTHSSDCRHGTVLCEHMQCTVSGTAVVSARVLRENSLEPDRFAVVVDVHRELSVCRGRVVRVCHRSGGAPGRAARRLGHRGRCSARDAGACVANRSKMVSHVGARATLPGAVKTCRG